MKALISACLIRLARLSLLPMGPEGLALARLPQPLMGRPQVEPLLMAGILLVTAIFLREQGLSSRISSPLAVLDSQAA